MLNARTVTPLRFIPIFSVVLRVAFCGFCSLGASSVFALNEGTTIIGTKEAPTVLNVVPWQNVELNLDAWNLRPSPARSVLEDSLKPIDKDVLRREVEYFNLLEDSASEVAK